MTGEETIVDKVRELVRELPADKQREVLDFAEFLKAKARQNRPRKSLKGLWADFNISISEEDIAELRREMWKNFPREDI